MSGRAANSGTTSRSASSSGRGLLRGLVLRRETPNLPEVARRHGLLIGMVGGGSVVRIAPPLVITEPEVDALAAALGAALREAAS